MAAQQNEFLVFRIEKLEEEVEGKIPERFEKVEDRCSALELAQARMLGWCAGAAAAGAFVAGLVQWALSAWKG